MSEYSEAMAYESGFEAGKRETKRKLRQFIRENKEEWNGCEAVTIWELDLFLSGDEEWKSKLN